MDIFQIYDQKPDDPDLRHAVEEVVLKAIRNNLEALNKDVDEHRVGRDEIAEDIKQLEEDDNSYDEDGNLLPHFEGIISELEEGKANWDSLHSGFLIQRNEFFRVLAALAGCNVDGCIEFSEIEEVIKEFRDRDER